MATLLTTGCIHTLNGDLGDLFSESTARSLDKQATPEYKLDPLALRNDVPADDQETANSTQGQAVVDEESSDELVFELLPDLPDAKKPLSPQITDQPLSPSEPDIDVVKTSSDIENDFTPLPPVESPNPNKNLIEFQPATAAAPLGFGASAAKPTPDESENSDSLVRIANNPLAPAAPIDVSPFETNPSNGEAAFEPLPPVDSPAQLFISEDMQQLPPPFANHPDVEPSVYPESEVSDVEIHVDATPESTQSNDDIVPAEIVPADEPDPVQFVNDLIDSSMDPQRLDELEDVSTRIASSSNLLPNKEAGTRLSIPEPVPPVKPLTWDEQLQKTVAAIEIEIEKSNGQQRQTLKSAKTVLQSLHSNLTNANDSVPGSVKQYWIHQINALEKIIANSIDDKNVNEITTETLRELQLAAGALRESANLQLNSAVFCRKVIGFGQYETFQSESFRPNQPVLVYCEIENFTPKIEKHGDHDIYLTRISSSYEIRDENGKVVQATEYPMVSDKARKLRNDFFMHLPIRFGDLRIGQYQLQIEVHDYGSGKKTQLAEPLQFSIQ